MSKTTKYLLAGGAILLVLLLLARSKASATTVKTTQLSGGASYLSGAGSLISALTSGYKTIAGGAGTNGEYTPDIAYGDDLTIGG